MVHRADDWSEMNGTTVVKEKQKKKKTAMTTTPKNVRESKGSGSRRIFLPAFKLQVLDSYRQDADCQGNQRATARKYGIHRRQIQKWLQMETNLRLSVQQQQRQQSNAATTLNVSSFGQRDDGNEEVVETKKSSSPRLKSDHQTHGSNDDEGCVPSDSDQYVNVDEITDSEAEFNDETSSCSSCEKTTDRALDFTTATLSNRKFYASDFKLHVLDAFKHDKTCQGDQRATARKFGIHRRQLQKWLNRESLIKSEQSCGVNGCLDLSHKRKLETVDEEMATSMPKRKLPQEEDVQESALPLVQNEIEPIESVSYLRTQYPFALEHSFNNGYPFCVYRPWNCCYQPTSSVNANLDAAISKYSYAFDSKYGTSYIDIPVQYGFGDSVPSKWIKETPLYIPEPPIIQVLSSYR